MVPRILAALLTPMALCLTASSVQAEILGYTARNSGSETQLTSVIVGRGGQVVAYDPAHLIPSQVEQFRSAEVNNVIAPPGTPTPDARARIFLLGDTKLNSGIINPGGQRETPAAAATDEMPGVVVRFAKPLVNRPGDDLVVFEIQRGDSPFSGDVLHVVPVDGAESVRPITIRSFDVTYDHPAAREVLPFTRHPAQKPTIDVPFHEAALKPNGSIGQFTALAVGIDLSRLGYSADAEVERLMLQSTGPGTAMVDLVLVAGLPEAVAPNVLAEVPKFDQPERLLDDHLDGDLSEVEQVVFAERIPGNDHWYANFGHYCCGRAEYPEQRLPEDWQPDPIFKPGGRLCLWNIRSRELTVLLDDPEGGVRDPQVHYDAEKILFSYRPGGDANYHLYEIGVDGEGLRQVTEGPYDDIEPAYMPDGRIVFVSSRCDRYVNCWRTPVGVLYSCEGDGSDLRMVSTNIEHDNTPWVLPDGRILYMRWEYVDRSQVDFHHLWTINPDGTGQMVYFGNQYPGVSMLDAKPIPHTRKIVSSFSPAHGRPEHMGYVTIVDPGSGPDDKRSATQVSRPRALFRDPYAMSEDCILVANAQGILLMDGQGNTELLCRGSGVGSLQCHEPRPVIRRYRERPVSSLTDPSKATGNLVLADIYTGRNMEGIERGDIKKLLVMEQLPKPVNFSGGPWPLSIDGTFSLSRILGTVPVEADGSAAFEVPAMRSIFLIALDDQDMSVKRMQSFVTLQPGETTSCVGCHEPRVVGPPPQPGLMALNRRPSRIEPITDVPSVPDFPRDIQPILNRVCVECHNPDKCEGQIDLSGDHTPLFAQSYWTIIHKALIADGRNEKHGNRPPRAIGSSASRLLKLLDGSHYGAKATPLEFKTMRLWIDASAVYPGTYAALGSGMHPVEFPVETMERRCGECHGSPRPKSRAFGKGSYFTFGPTGPPVPLVHDFADLKKIRGIGYFKFGFNRRPQSFCNLTRPDKSLMVRAPLAKSGGGLEVCGKAVFADTSDSDYQTLLGRIQAASALHMQEKRFDMADFRPNDHYLRQMQTYGILPADLPPTGPIDVYATDEAYWQSFWYEPESR